MRFRCWNCEKLLGHWVLFAKIQRTPEFPKVSIRPVSTEHFPYMLTPLCKNCYEVFRREMRNLFGVWLPPYEVPSQHDSKLQFIQDVDGTWIINGTGRSPGSDGFNDINEPEVGL